MTWDGREREREMRRICVGLLQLLIKGLAEIYAFFYNLVSFRWEAVMAVAHGKDSINISLVVKSVLLLEPDCLDSNPGSITH